MTTANLRLLLTMGLFLAADAAAWALSYGKLYAIQGGRCPDAWACAEASLAAAGLFWALDLVGQLSGWMRVGFILACGVVPVVVRRMM